MYQQAIAYVEHSVRQKGVVTHIPLTKVIIRVLAVHVILITVVSTVVPAIFILR